MRLWKVRAERVAQIGQNETFDRVSGFSANQSFNGSHAVSSV